MHTAIRHPATWIVSALVAVCVVLVCVEALGETREPARGKAAVREVLRGKEFRALVESKPSSFGRWCVYRVKFWLYGRESAERMGRIQPILTWILAGMALVLAAVLIYMTWRLVASREGRGRLAGAAVRFDSAPATPADPREHLARAERLAGEGDFRGALHELQLSALSLLESRGIVPEERSRTNWEYVQRSRARLSASQLEALEAVCRTFDRKWYGHGACGREDFDGVASHVRALNAELGHE